MRKIIDLYRRNPYGVWVGIFLILALAMIGMIFLQYTFTSYLISPDSYCWWLFIAILPTAVFAWAISKMPGAFKMLRKDLAVRWSASHPEQVEIEHNPGRGSRFSRLFNIDFGITLLSTPKNILLPFLGRLILTIWSFGWILYTVAVWADINGVHSVTGTLLYAAMSSFDLFLFDINGNIIDNIDLPGLWTGILKGLLGITSILASCALGSIVIGMFLTRFINFLKSKAIRMGDGRYKNLYIFFDQTESAQILADDILKNDAQGVVVTLHSANVKDDEADGWENILGIFASRERMKSMSDINSRRLHLHTSRTVEEADEMYRSGKYPSLWESLDVTTLSRLIKELGTTPGAHLRLFFMSDNRDRNVLNTKIFADELEKDSELDQVDKSIYCVSRQDGVTSVIEDRYDSSLLKIKILDDSRLSVQEIIRNPDCHPIRFVEIDKRDAPGTVKSKFTSLIVGFGETGRDIFRFLYEYGAFPDAENLGREDHQTTLRSAFECHIVDPDIDRLKAPLVAGAPSIFSENGLGDRNLIRFYPSTDTSEEFFKLLDSIGEDLNYVVVATGDDERNITVAVRILQYVIRKRGKNKLENFRIFIRTYESESFSHLENVTRHYNELYGNDYLQVFGHRENIYSYSHVILDKETEEARNYHNMYSKIESGNNQIDETDYWQTLWENLDYNTYLERMVKKKKVPMSRAENKLDVKRQIDESRKNSLHAPTKLYILEEVLRENGVSQPVENVKLMLSFMGTNAFDERFTQIKEGAKTENGDVRKKLLYNLCRLEHLRWNASHQLRGFRYGEVKNFISLEHPCLVPWEKLDDGSRTYDYLVVETSLNLKK